ncbi:MAG: glycosyltransferase family 39 protein [Novosphingobium sp.]
MAAIAAKDIAASESHSRAGTRGVEWGILLLLWGVATAYNLFKAYHIDDTAHLLIAQSITRDWLHPMSGLLNWSGTDEPIWRTNQPHLYFYLMAAWGRLFGYSEPAMHALQSLFSLAAIVLAWRVSRQVLPEHALWATALLVLGPAFIVSQNMMVDVPLLALWLVFYHAVLKCGANGQGRWLLVAALATAAAILVKYSSLVLLPVLLVCIVMDGRWRYIWVLLVPLGALLGWSAFNWLDYGGIHMLDRQVGSAGEHPLWFYPLALLGAGMTVLGAIVPLGVIVLAAACRRFVPSAVIWLATVLGLVALAVAVKTGAISDTTADLVLALVFIANTLLMAVAIGLALLPLASGRFWSPREIWREHRQIAILLLWLASTWSFYLLFAPFMAVRHVLLVLLPTILLFGVVRSEALTLGARAWALAFTMALSAGIGLADWQLADHARREAQRLRADIPQGGTLWAHGHWGFQWYTTQEGMPQVDASRNMMQPGDRLALGPDMYPSGFVASDPRLKLLRVDEFGVGSFNPICTGRPASFYVSTWHFPPWTLSRNCTTSFRLYEVRQ